MFLLESYTPGQGCTTRYLPGCTIACFSTKVHHGMYSLVAWHGAFQFHRVISNTYQYVLIYTGMYLYILGYKRTFRVCTSTEHYILIHAGMH
jgi:hypothetical protein